ncbi:MAG: EAL domain-containing protein [Candidatus Paracaedibacter sp.]|jgi:EAL domain-containing protein (putative c-di-GMP-specific phosphodiesterase class I)
MTLNTLSSSFSASIDDVLNYSARFQKKYGFIVIVIDHLSEQHSHIANLTSYLYPYFRKMVRSTDTIIRFTPDAWLICVDDCDDRLLQWMKYTIQSLLNRLHAQITSPLDGALTFVQESFLQANTTSQAMKAFENEVQIAKSSLRRLKTIRSSALGPIDTPNNTQSNGAPLIHRAILDNRLFLVFQPIVETESRQLHHYECLARILDEKGQVVPAAQFMASCEKTGLIQLIDQKVQQLAIQELMADRQLRLAINVSAITASDSVWLNTLKAQMTARPDLGERLAIELTETSVFQDVDESIHFITQLRDLGCQVSIDDFGAGYMSLMHLKSDLIQHVKIDAQFVKNLKPKSNNIHFIRAIIALTHPQGIKCVAEGVEDANTAAILTQENLDYLQGYFIGKPSPFRDWM